MMPVPEPLCVLAVTNLWPYEDDPSHGAFVASQMRSVEAQGVQVDVDFVNGRENTLAYLKGAARMFSLNFRRRRYDLLHAHAGHTAVLARLQWRYPVLVSYVGYDLYGRHKTDGGITLKSRVEAAVFRRLSHVVDATITKSARMEELLPRSVRGRNTVLPNGVNRGIFQPIARDQARHLLGWPTDEVTVLFVGRTDWPRKRADLAHAACASAAREIPGLRFRVCEGLEHRHVPVWLSAADALLLPSLAEGSPNVVKEALACDLPVVATDVGDVPQLLGGVERCHVLPVDASADEFAAALVDVLRNAPARSNGRACTAHLDEEAIARRLIDIYATVARGQQERSRVHAAKDIARI